MKYKVTLNGKNYEVEVERGEAILLGVSDVPAAPAVMAAPVIAPVAVAATPAPTSVMAGGEPLNSPMPGTILSIKAVVGQQVKKGEVLLVLEAMKMENEITAPRDATIVQVVTTAGASVNTGDTLLVLG